MAPHPTGQEARTFTYITPAGEHTFTYITRKAPQAGQTRTQHPGLIWHC